MAKLKINGVKRYPANYEVFVEDVENPDFSFTSHVSTDGVTDDEGNLINGTPEGEQYAIEQTILSLIAQGNEIVE
jgi:hypothetical protein